ncbi:MAG: hypothetical protein KGS60_11160 [Verrucomicrobia bacterium]|nr:hypothetical protein [Verrucomicrobiota bacterium]
MKSFHSKAVAVPAVMSFAIAVILAGGNARAGAPSSAKQFVGRLIEGSGAACAQNPSTAPELLKPAEALPSVVGAGDARPGYVAPADPSAFRTEDSLVIEDPSLDAGGLDLAEVVHEVNDRVRLDVWVNGSMGYSSNTLLKSDNEVGGWVSWASVGLSLDVGDESALGLYYGVDLLGSVFQYDTRRASGGRNNTEPMLNAYVGMRGAKTNVRVSSMFRANQGNVVDYSDTQREQRRAQSRDYNITLSGQRQLAHGYLTGSYTIDNRDFAQGTGLNDSEGLLTDVAWFYRPGFAPKTDFGLGLRAGQFNTANNFDQTYVQPSIRTNYTFSRKTQVFSRIGYDLRNFDGVGSIGSTGSFVYELGSKWSPSPKTALQMSVYKDFSPSVVSGFENFNRAGLRSSFTYGLPWWELRLRLEGNYEHADYFSTVQNLVSTRADDYWLFGSSLSKTVPVTRFLDGDITTFYYYTTNDSTNQVNQFQDHFTGVRFGVTY